MKTIHPVMSSRGCFKRIWCSCGCENGTQVFIPAWVLSVFFLGGHWARRFGCARSFCKTQFVRASCMSPADFAKQKLVNLHKLWLLRGPFCYLWFHAWAERQSLNNQAWVMSPSPCWRGRNQVLHQAVSQLPRTSSRVNTSGYLMIVL